MTEVPGTQTPPQGTPAPEQTGQNTLPPAPVVSREKELEQKLIEAEAQKEHWRSKYDRDITNVQQPVTPEPSEDVFSDEGKAILQKYVTPLESKITSLEDQLALKDIQAKFPELKELNSEFEEYRKEYPRHKLENVAKLFLDEKGLGPSQPRKGLEQATGGPRNAPSLGKMTAEEVKQLRETNFKLYQDKLMRGEIQIANS